MALAVPCAWWKAIAAATASGSALSFDFEKSVYRPAPWCEPPKKLGHADKKISVLVKRPRQRVRPTGQAARCGLVGYEFAKRSHDFTEKLVRAHRPKLSSSSAERAHARAAAGEAELDLAEVDLLLDGLRALDAAPSGQALAARVLCRACRAA